ncbi:MAG: recombination protein NinG [Pseudomonas sp.]|nr:recombination protein NinG [Pseudomonas sp.]
MIQKPPRPKKCRNPACGQTFTPQRMGQHVCSPLCGLAIKDVNQDKAKKAMAHTERLEHKAAKEKVKRKGDHAKEAQQAFNAWVRLRDHGLPCISCGTTADVQYAAGHFKPSGSNPALRFDPLNVHLQCNRNCNMAKSGNLGPYRIELIKRIGQDKVDWLEGPQEPKRYTVEDLQVIKKHYRALVREMKKQI